jgi:hypothetical protein
MFPVKKKKKERGKIRNKVTNMKVDVCFGVFAMGWMFKTLLKQATRGR